MATVLEDLVVYVPTITTSPTLVFGTNLFAGLLPDDPKIANLVVALNEYPGSPPMDTMTVTSSGAPQMEQPNIQVMVRSDEDDYLTARNLINAVYNGLHKVVNLTINGTRYQRIKAEQTPFLAHRDSQRRSYFACNFSVTRTP